MSNIPLVGSLHHRLLGRWFDAIVNRLNSALGQLRAVREELTEVRSKADLLAERQAALEQQMEQIAAAHWDTTAASRRLAAIEDRIGSSEHRQ